VDRGCRRAGLLKGVAEIAAEFPGQTALQPDKGIVGLVHENWAEPGAPAPGGHQVEAAGKDLGFVKVVTALDSMLEYLVSRSTRRPPPPRSAGASQAGPELFLIPVTQPHFDRSFLPFLNLHRHRMVVCPWGTSPAAPRRSGTGRYHKGSFGCHKSWRRRTGPLLEGQAAPDQVLGGLHLPFHRGLAEIADGPRRDAQNNFGGVGFVVQIDLAIQLGPEIPVVRKVAEVKAFLFLIAVITVTGPGLRGACSWSFASSPLLIVSKPTNSTAVTLTGGPSWITRVTSTWAVPPGHLRGEAGVIKPLGAVKQAELLDVSLQVLVFENRPPLEGTQEGRVMVICWRILPALMVWAPTILKDRRVRAGGLPASSAPRRVEARHPSSSQTRITPPRRGTTAGAGFPDCWNRYDKMSGLSKSVPKPGAALW